MVAGPLVVVSRAVGSTRRTLQLGDAGTVTLAPSDVKLPGGVRLTASGAGPGARLTIAVGDPAKVRRCLVNQAGRPTPLMRRASAEERAQAMERLPPASRATAHVDEQLEFLAPGGLLEVFTFRAEEERPWAPPAPEVLDALVALHAADTPEARQVLHDRLVECGASAEAAYVRLQRALGAISSADSALVQRAARSLREASRLVGPTFRYLVARDVEGCAGLRWALRCPKSWHQLRDLGQAESRYCDTCRQEVFRVSTEFEAQRLGREGRCVALFIDDDRVEMGEVA